MSMLSVTIGVRLTIPDGMAPAQACREVKTSIGFGHAEVVLLGVEQLPELEVTDQ